MSTDGLNYRSYGNEIIIGGFDHRTGRHRCSTYFEVLSRAAAGFTEERGPPQGEKRAHAVSRSRSDDGKPASQRLHWAANDCVTHDKVPYAGKMFRFRKSAFVISGFGKWGMTNSYVSAKIVDDIISRRKNSYRRLFKPTRILNIAVWPTFMWNFLLDGMGLVAGLFSSGKRRCPHMGCRLKYNPSTKTYDCPCHGSRLTENGDIIVSPAVDANDKLMQYRNKK